MMMHQNTPEEDLISYVESYFDAFINRGQDRFKSIIDLIITETEKVCKGGDLWDVNREYFCIIFYLHQNHKDYFKVLSTNGINEYKCDNKIYSEIHSLLLMPI